MCFRSPPRHKAQQSYRLGRAAAEQTSQSSAAAFLSFRLRVGRHDNVRSPQGQRIGLGPDVDPQHNQGHMTCDLRVWYP
eukprot:CAMPEP_0174303110 /NCGR_PEP_ID=MMETSP0809-20121228/59993_1 /TAXON_ID=73025 ORGANISM="Eutreptiella gymnastica-like, Strain CCMP1594" /NCGR_SAMPLE_ID=MMETSP0809 /ASSEMBLY_ACC=CAM_ASM_000658 /LENGTH=78 /DNA_ID=CAMNT_0015409077 /DNA_START=261 /DNA_END=497 /DNA_ORIENTATION=+